LPALVTNLPQFQGAEDVLEILMRMKEIVLKSYSSQPQIGRLLVTGPATVTVAHFDLPSEVEVIDPNQYVATLADGAKLEMEFRIEEERGIAPSSGDGTPRL